MDRISDEELEREIKRTAGRTREALEELRALRNRRGNRRVPTLGGSKRAAHRRIKKWMEDGVFERALRSAGTLGTNISGIDRVSCGECGLLFEIESR